MEDFFNLLATSVGVISVLLALKAIQVFWLTGRLANLLWVVFFGGAGIHLLVIYLPRYIASTH